MPEVETFKPGDVLRYVPRSTWCHEGTALVTEAGRVIDTYWTHDPTVLAEDELSTAELLFNVGDYEQLDEYARTSRGTWETYHSDDRARYTHQHGLQEVLFIRKGAAPDLSTQIENAKAKVEEAEGHLRSAEHRLEWARDDLSKLETTAMPSTRSSAQDGEQTA